jgi:IrrE N-terminal-like domain
VDRALRRAEALIRLDELLDSVQGATPPAPPPPRLDGVGRGPAVDQGRRLAGLVRKVLRLGDGPLAALPEVLEERLRLDVSPLPEAVDGLCVSVGDRALVLVGSRKPSNRQRFTPAHELAHYLVDDLDPLYVDERGGRPRSVPKCAPTPSLRIC